MAAASVSASYLNMSESSEASSSGERVVNPEKLTSEIEVFKVDINYSSLKEVLKAYSYRGDPIQIDLHLLEKIDEYKNTVDRFVTDASTEEGKDALSDAKKLRFFIYQLERTLIAAHNISFAVIPMMKSAIETEMKDLEKCTVEVIRSGIQRVQQNLDYLSRFDFVCLRSEIEAVRDLAESYFSDANEVIIDLEKENAIKAITELSGILICSSNESTVCAVLQTAIDVGVLPNETDLNSIFVLKDDGAGVNTSFETVASKTTLENIIHLLENNNFSVGTSSNGEVISITHVTLEPVETISASHIASEDIFDYLNELRGLEEYLSGKTSPEFAEFVKDTFATKTMKDKPKCLLLVIQLAVCNSTPLYNDVKDKLGLSNFKVTIENVNEVIKAVGEHFSKTATT